MDRTISKLALILLNILPFILIFLTFIQKKKELIFLLKKYWILIISLLYLCVVIFFSAVVSGTPLSEMFTTLIYHSSFLLFALFFLLIREYEIISFREIKFYLLFLFYMYIFFCLFYFFYVLGKPMSSGGLRVPIISHVFFCCSLLPVLRLYLNQKEMMVAYTSFIPIMFLSDKSSVLIITTIFIVADFFSLPFPIKYKKTIKTMSWVCFGLMCLILLISNFLPGTFLYERFSFYGFVIKSGRFQNWQNILNNLPNFTFINYFLGKGIGATLVVNNGVAAHNDFIEYFYDFGILGLLGLILFLSHFIISLLKSLKKKRKQIQKNITLVLSYILIIMLISSLFSNGNLFLGFSICCLSGVKERGLLHERQKIYPDYWNLIV